MINLKKLFINNSVIVFGKKGSGKDLLTQKIIYKRKEPYYSNIDYGGTYQYVKLSEMQFLPNEYLSVMDKGFTLVEKRFDEKRDFYISDCGVYLPSQYSGILDKKYPGLPMFYALTRHAFNSNIHLNCQYLGRVWNKLREQADYYIKCWWVLNLGFFLVGKVTVYNRYSSALQEVTPLKHSHNRTQKSDIDIFNSQYGLIKNKYYCILKYHISYDTRVFHKYLFGRKAPSKKELKKERDLTDLVDLKQPLKL